MSTLCPNCWGSKTEPLSTATCVLCAGTGTVPDTQLSRHFTLSEMWASQTAVRNHVSNAPPHEFELNLEEVCNQLLEPIRAQFGPLHVDSGFRGQRLNSILNGSATHSAHMFGLAADINPLTSGVTRKQIVDWVIGNLKFDQVISRELGFT
jgi:zinc D-Ala-D-Ala carboxypeptidase